MMEPGPCHRCTEPAPPPGEKEFTLPENPLEESFDTPAMKGSVQQALSRNLGEYVSCEFLLGTATITMPIGPKTRSSRNCSSGTPAAMSNTVHSTA